METAYFNSPIGKIEIKGNDGLIRSLCFTDDSNTATTSTASEYLGQCIKQLDYYFNGKLHKFDIKTGKSGTEFQNKVWTQLCDIVYGSTSSYKEIAESISSPKAFRAVGQANNRNPISVIVPCHRVVAHDGSLSGYAGGIWRKEWLLKHETNYKNFL